MIQELDMQTPLDELTKLLDQLEFLEGGEKITKISKPGEGNMNVVLRVQTDARSFIVKQSRTYVQKYPSIAAPIDRIDTEVTFYNAISQAAAADQFPAVLGYSRDHHLLLLSDLGDCQDMSSLYNSHKISLADIRHLCEILVAVHNCKVGDSYPPNLDLRRLNHQHIFVLPFVQDNGFQLDDVQDGLQELSLPYKSDERLHEIIYSVGEQYLSAGDTLLHGDFYPGSWMSSIDDIYVLDPEFSFVGFREFDIGIMMAHLILVTGTSTVINHITKAYDLTFDQDLAQKVAGIEIMRRLIGLAQLPLDRSLNEKKELLQLAYRLVIGDLK